MKFWIREFLSLWSVGSGMVAYEIILVPQTQFSKPPPFGFIWNLPYIGMIDSVVGHWLFSFLINHNGTQLKLTRTRVFIPWQEFLLFLLLISAWRALFIFKTQVKCYLHNVAFLTVLLLPHTHNLQHNCGPGQMKMQDALLSKQQKGAVKGTNTESVFLSSAFSLLLLFAT